MIKTILVPVDGSGHAAKAAELAADIAAKYGARVVVLHVLLRHTAVPDLLVLARALDAPAATVERLAELEGAMLDSAAVPYAYAGPVPVVVPDAVLTALGDAILARTRRAVEAKGVEDVGAHVADAAPADAILEAARHEGADMVVMGSRGLSRIEGLLMGSVSGKVFHLAPCTCVAVK